LSLAAQDLLGAGHSLVESNAFSAAWDTAAFAVQSASAGGWSRSRERCSEEESQQANILREVFGNPFRRVSLVAGSLTQGILSVARAVYDNQDFGVMPNLADALEDAGCTDAELLGHLRGPGVHVRGCWALDLLLAKS